MSSLSIHVRKQLAVRRMIAVFNAHAFAADADAGFDAGEFSGPAHSRMEQREIIAICATLRVSAHDAMMAVQYGDDPDPMGSWHGRNE